MEFEIEWLLVLPLFFGLGWLAAQWDSRKRAQESRKLPKSYFKGLNHLLDQEPDKAIDALIDVARVDTGTVDLYFALGHLFSQRGEVERSIRVYQSLIDRPDLSDAPRQSASMKLGTAFLSGGLFDRAEQCFQSLMHTPREHEAQVQLLHIYQSQQEWQQAIDMAQAINRNPLTRGTQNLALSHYYCELATSAMRQKQWLEAQTQIERALNERASSTRAAILKGQWYAEQGRHTEALAVWQQLIQAQPSAMPLLAKDMVQSYVANEQAQQGVAYLYEQAMQTGSIDVGQAWFKANEQYGDPSQAYEQLDALFTKHPSFNALNQLLNARIKEEEASSEQERSKAALIRGLIQKQVKQLSRYRCANCGFEAAHYYWQCPACSRWESYPPKRLEELESQMHTRNNPNNY